MSLFIISFALARLVFPSPLPFHLLPVQSGQANQTSISKDGGGGGVTRLPAQDGKSFFSRNIPDANPLTDGSDVEASLWLLPYRHL